VRAAFARLGPYQPESLLGQGSVTETFLARRLEPLSSLETQTFVVKALRRGHYHPELGNRFVDAARMLQWTSLAGVAGVVEIGEEPGPIFAAFEFKEGVDLRHLRLQALPSGGAMDGRVVGLLGRKLAERLGPLHAQSDGPRVHGGLSPGNVLVRPSGDPLLLDCGLAEALRFGESFPAEGWQYLSPEQLRGEPAGRTTDLYSLGALMYFLCYGRPPFEAGTPRELEARIAQGPPAFDGLHPAIASSMARLLSYSVQARPKSAADVIRQISVALLSANAGIAVATPAPLVPQATVVRPSPSPAVPAALPGPSLAGHRGERESASKGEGEVIEDEQQRRHPPVVKPGKGQPSVHERNAIAPDDPDVGAVFDDDDQDDEIDVAPNGTARRRHRHRGIRLLEWTKDAFARSFFRYAWVPVAVFLLIAAVEGFFFVRSWRAARIESARKDQAFTEEQARIEAAKPKLAAAPALEAGQLVLKINPSGAVIWLDGIDKGTAPMTVLTTPGGHRLVITAPGHRMLRDVVDATRGVLFERTMAAAAFPTDGSVGLNVACTTEGKNPVFIDGKEIGAFCPLAGVRLDPGKHRVGLFIIAQNRLLTVDREVVLGRPDQVQFDY